MVEDTLLSLRTAVELPLIEDLRRARELYRYAQPQHFLPKPSDRTDGTQNSEPAATALMDALEPYVQLASLRCNAQRAFIT